MTDGKQRADIQKIEETIRKLESLKEQDLLPADQVDASIAALKQQLPTSHVEMEGDSPAALGMGAKAVGRNGILIEGNVYLPPEPRDSQEELGHLLPDAGHTNQFTAFARRGRG